MELTRSASPPTAPYLLGCQGLLHACQGNLRLCQLFTLGPHHLQGGGGAKQGKVT